MKIEARIFRFNAEHDYLSAYQPFIFNAGGESTLLDLLSAFKQSDPLCVMRLDKVMGVKANGLGAKLNAPLSAFAKNGGEIVVEPLVGERAALDLECDRRDFEAKLSALDEFCDQSDRAYYDEFYTAYAVSPMRELNGEYLGEAVFMLADRLIGRNPQNAEVILKRISQAKSGIFCFAGLNGVLLDEASRITRAVERLCAATLSLGFAPKDAAIAKYAAIKPSDLPSLEGKKVAISTDCGAFGGAIGLGDYESALSAGGAEVLRLKNPARFSGSCVADSLPDAALKAASDLVLEAVDCGADTLLCVAGETARFLAQHLNALARIVGRALDITIAPIAR
jgi:hypothetical protein